MHNITLKHPRLGIRHITVEASSIKSDSVDWIELSPIKASKELFEASDYYKATPDTQKRKPNWALTLKTGVSIVKRGWG